MKKVKTIRKILSGTGISESALAGHQHSSHGGEPRNRIHTPQILKLAWSHSLFTGIIIQIWMLFY